MRIVESFVLLCFSVTTVCSLSCFDCSGAEAQKECTTKKVTTGWSPAAVEQAKCMVATGDGNIIERRLVSESDYCTDDAKAAKATEFKDSGGYSKVNVYCCDDNECNKVLPADAEENSEDNSTNGNDTSGNLTEGGGSSSSRIAKNVFLTAMSGALAALLW